MKNILLEQTNQHHKDFLNKIDFVRDFNPFKLKTWHHDFNLIEDCPAIPIFEIQEKPTIKITTIKDFIKDNDITNNLVKKAIETLKAKEEDNTKSRSDNSTASDNSFLSKFISKDLIEKIRIKEEAVNIGKDIMEYSKSLVNKKSNIAIFKEVCDKVKTIMMQKTGSIKMNELIDRILENSSFISQTHTIGIILLIFRYYTWDY